MDTWYLICYNPDTQIWVISTFTFLFLFSDAPLQAPHGLPLLCAIKNSYQLLSCHCLRSCWKTESNRQDLRAFSPHISVSGMQYCLWTWSSFRAYKKIQGVKSTMQRHSFYVMSRSKEDLQLPGCNIGHYYRKESFMKDLDIDRDNASVNCM